jgi:hypothetical protein
MGMSAPHPVAPRVGLLSPPAALCRGEGGILAIGTVPLAVWRGADAVV